MQPVEERDYEVDRQRHVQAFGQGLPEEVDHVEASREALHRIRDRRLNALLDHAREHSPWHRKRLASLGSAAVSGNDLRAIPSMTKSELMQHWDEIVCDRRLSRALANDHIETVGQQGPVYLLDSYHAAATGGTTGHRGVVVWDFEGFRLCGSRPTAWGMSVSRLLHLGIEPPLDTGGESREDRNAGPRNTQSTAFHCRRRNGSISGSCRAGGCLPDSWFRRSRDRWSVIEIFAVCARGLGSGPRSAPVPETKTLPADHPSPRTAEAVSGRCGGHCHSGSGDPRSPGPELA
jgi:hypothetical protein